jgi:hypothetical protein
LISSIFRLASILTRFLVSAGLQGSKTDNVKAMMTAAREYGLAAKSSG